MTELLELLSYPFFRKALVAGLLVSVLCGLVSVFVVLRRMSFIGAGISHAAFGGVAIGFYLGVSPVLSAVCYSVVTAVLIAEVVRQGGISEDTAIGIFFSASMALGVLFIGLSKNYAIDLFGYLFGNILAVEDSEIAVMAVMAAAVLCAIALLFKKLYIASFNEELARIAGINTRLLDLTFLVILAVVIVVSMKVVGIVLVSALLVIPAACARAVTAGIGSMAVVSVASAVLSTFAGLALSYAFDLPSGGTIVMVLAVLFFLSLVIRRLRS